MALAACIPPMPNPTLTPGATVDVALAKLCTPGYSKSVRNVPQAEKKQVYKEYNITPNPPGETYEVDHLISLELGGSNDIKNLWPEPYFGCANAHDKDKLENALHWAVCAKKVSLSDAQHMISTDWVGAYRKFVGPPPWEQP